MIRRDILALTGNYKLLAKLIEKLVKQDMWGFNQLHHDVVAKKDLGTDKIHTASVTKKGT